MSETKQDNQDKAPETVAVPDKFKSSDGAVNTEALLKSYTDLEKDRSRVVSEIDHLKKELDLQRQTAKLAEGIEKIVQNTTPKQEQQPSWDDYLSNLANSYAEEMGLEPDDPAVKLAVKLNSETAKASSTWMKDDIEAIKQQYTREIEELRGLVHEDKAQRIKSTPEYIAHKEDINELIEAGMDEGKAIQFVLKKAANTSDVSTPPPSMPSGRKTSEPAVSAYWNSPEEREEMVQIKGEDRVKQMEALYDRRIRGE